MAILITCIALIIFILVLDWLTNRNKGKEDEIEEFIVDEDYINNYISRCSSTISSKEKTKTEKDRVGIIRRKKRN